MTWRSEDLLTAYREHRGPPADAVDRIEARLRQRARPRHARGRRVVATAVAVAAAVVLVGGLTRVVAVRDDPTTPSSLASDHAPARSEGGAREPSRPSSPDPSPDSSPDSSPASSPAPRSTRPSADQAPRPGVTPSARDTSDESTPRPAPGGAKARPRPAPTSDPTPTTPARGPTVDSLAAETRMLQRARASLFGGRPDEALSILDDYRARFPAGALTEEADAVRTMTQCRREPARAAAQGRRFIERHPRSLFRAQVKAACEPAPQK